MWTTLLGVTLDRWVLRQKAITTCGFREKKERVRPFCRRDEEFACPPVLRYPLPTPTHLARPVGAARRCGRGAAVGERT